MDSMLEAQAKVDEEIHRLKQHIQQLLIFRNSIALINQLPTETFVQIFKSCQPESVDYRKDDNEDRAIRFDWWLNITQVCQRWRSIAFDSKEFWTTIPMHNPAYIDLASKLSYPLPIHLFDTTEDTGIDEAFHDLYLSLLRRAEKVDVRFSTGLFVAEALGDASSQFPLLQELRFNGLQIAYLPMSPFPESLKSITLSNCSFTWSWLELNHLTELHISATYSEDQISVPSFVGYLLQLPNLAFLEVVNLFKTASTSAQASPSTLRLRHLVVSDEILLVSKFLSSIHFVPDFTLTAELLYHGNVDEGQVFLESLVPHLQASQHLIRGAVLNCGDGEALHFSGRVPGFSCQCLDENASSPFLRIDADANATIAETWLDLTQAFGMDQLQHLSVKAFSGVMPWKKWPFRDLVCLRELTIGDSQSFRGFLELLAADTHSARGSNDWDRILFPALKVLTFQNVECAEEERLQMADVLRARRDHGRGLEKLIFEGGNITDEPAGTELMIQVVDKLTVKPAEVPCSVGFDSRRKF
ncbi:hypothetical protein BDN72DRAFT_850176 [Pluteus cervinus]|uniref:Uncharacterized protein n=1 Tax=Pluteus cervinus TaxID=181527 RepID=A0ACD3A5J8_9AGAR|nr:hypothetical protein BDN72DRAFT_850176 [Pluteus cervinus]